MNKAVTNQYLLLMIRNGDIEKVYGCLPTPIAELPSHETRSELNPAKRHLLTISKAKQMLEHACVDMHLVYFSRRSFDLLTNDNVRLSLKGSKASIISFVPDPNIAS
jgi:hypothetical protein